MNIMTIPAKKLLLTLLASAILFLFAACSSSSSQDPNLKDASRFTLPSAQGGNVSLESYIGEENVVLVFYEGLY